MHREPKPFAALETEEHQIILHAPLDLLEKLVAKAAMRGDKRKIVPVPVSELQEAASITAPEAAETELSGEDCRD